MEYTVQKLAKLAGISTRTLRYYDEINLLKPARINSSGYRIYGQEEIDTLQQILFYRELGVDLNKIKTIIKDPSFDGAQALKEHRQKLLKKREQLDELIANINKTLALKEGRVTMSNKEKFEGFKKQMVDENEDKYGKEIREKYGDDTVDASNANLMNMSQEDYEHVIYLEKQVQDTLAKAFATGDPTSELAQKAAQLHKEWLCYYWKEYSKDAHAGLAQMYVDDERFKAYYNKNQSGTAEFLRDAIHIYTGVTK